MILRQSIQKLLYMLILNFSFTQDCIILNPTEYGDCNNSLGYVWTGSDCFLTYGCDMGQDAEFFFFTSSHFGMIFIDFSKENQWF